MLQLIEGNGNKVKDLQRLIGVIASR